MWKREKKSEKAIKTLRAASVSQALEVRASFTEKRQCEQSMSIHAFSVSNAEAQKSG
jgi:hypothetical protein